MITSSNYDVYTTLFVETVCGQINQVACVNAYQVLNSAGIQANSVATTAFALSLGKFSNIFNEPLMPFGLFGVGQGFLG